ncbi:NAD(P)/FAD-dependent oxidoreductase [Adhaeribacter sp. BT258]|uniref:NADH:ubiquinone reductase (non-electrogenic) n=1 Tax=Adhaeribacter terrigena TaxID=2793070 RepID=A0ABS1C022_9BACT|nr:NAD(P)/FAD-dependent oxidoreductase [Adhaeribacter terrigena]MBK0402751.1 NAD(P)/FAD-dependent oxidoreductase [Adhaeribacter terrigena]
MTKKIVIIGGGFAGVNLANSLSGEPEFQVTLVDKNNYNFFPPLLYQVATGFLEVSNISYPFRKLLQGKPNLNFRLGELMEVKPEENKIVLSNGELEYDYLVMATGTETNYFGIDNIRKNAQPMKTVHDAINLRNFMLQKSEEATLATDDNERRKLTTIVVAGGGPTGVEVAGMLAEMRKNIGQKDYPELTGIESEIYLVDGGPSVLAPMSKASQQYTHDSLVELGVNVKLNKQVINYEDDLVTFADGETIETKILIWAAGVTGKMIAGMPTESYGRGRRLLVNEYNKVENTENIFAIGDIALQTSDGNFPNGHPQVAQVAIQQGKLLARNLKAQQEHKPLKAFAYHDRGSMAIIGRKKAVADLPKPKLHFNGFVAWVMWLFVHLVSLITVPNRVKTLYNWMIAYFTKDQAMRLIIRPAENAMVKPEKTARLPELVKAA